MSYLKFDKEQLTNLEYSLNREILRSNRAGSYISTALNGCNTRKYHGLLVCPIRSFNNEKHVLLSSFDLSLVQGEEEFELGVHRYKGGHYAPRGHMYIHNIEFDYIPTITYKVGSVQIIMERLLVEKKEQILIRYRVEGITEKVTLRFKPFLAFRNIHGLSKANLYVNKKYREESHGISVQLYEGYPDLYMQFSKQNEFIPVPDWYYNIEYLKELHRGYDFLEDLFVPGYFELEIDPGESVIFSASTEQAAPRSLKQRFSKEIKKRIQRFTFIRSLKNAAEQFILKNRSETYIIAGFPWYDNITRQTFISLPGLAIATENHNLFPEVLNTCKKYLINGLFPDIIHIGEMKYHSADAPLWFIWAIQQYAKSQRSLRGVWLAYGQSIKEILEAYRNGLPDFITCTSDGLINAEKDGIALTWMDSYSEGRPVVQRGGLTVEINALWYNAIQFSLVMADAAEDQTFIHQWRKIGANAGAAFLKTFWNQGHNHLADVVREGSADWSVRPNMVIAAAMDHTPLAREQIKQILSVAKRKLITPKGLRTLSPDHLRYKGVVEGGPDQREAALHMGAAWPWLMQFFTKAYLEIHGTGGLPYVKQLLEQYEESVTEHCIGTLSELYNGDPPHQGKGAISQAWNVAGVYHAIHRLQNYK